MQVLLALSGGHLVYLEVDLIPDPMAVESDDSDDLVSPPAIHPRATFRLDSRVYHCANFVVAKFKQIFEHEIAIMRCEKSCSRLPLQTMRHGSTGVRGVVPRPPPLRTAADERIDR